MDIFVLIVGALIVLFIGALAVMSKRKDTDKRGSEPGKGYHTLTSDYQSGMGGGHVTTWKVPRDPQEYAKRFVPKDTPK
ncbi:hypothetical protein [Roseovarius aestuarii]|uniref:Uncharacterized protein n=1 Tax=Roseovarius aestuarii TaxID=475083 RepID=A0A1X7BQC7_9RHOB|nr:hypothetical protein [Roseovarius aestuarii]SMC11764.1 hypothetical protein ROA7745_01583 [Roseovarius aestuarii]